MKILPLFLLLFLFKSNIAVCQTTSNKLFVGKIKYLDTTYSKQLNPLFENTSKAGDTLFFYINDSSLYILENGYLPKYSMRSKIGSFKILSAGLFECEFISSEYEKYLPISTKQFFTLKYQLKIKDSEILLFANGFYVLPKYRNKNYKEKTENWIIVKLSFLSL